MARQNNKKKKKEDTLDFVQVDAYMIPAPQAEMYRVLREAVAQDVILELESKFNRVDRISDEEEGEAIVAFDGDEHETIRIYLNPTNVSQAQKARDRDQIDKFVENFM